MDCVTCGIVSKYVDLANSFTQDLSSALLPGMWALFGAIVGIWVILHGYMFIIASPKADIGRFVGELIPVMIAAILLQGQGPEFVNNVYYAALNTMGAAAGMALSVGGGIPVAECASCALDNTGLTALVATAEAGIVNVFQIAENIVEEAGFPAVIIAAFYALALVFPYVAALIVFFSQVIISIFRILMISALSPFLMLGFAFGWGRSMAVAGVRTVLASFMVLFGTTCALAVMLYGVYRLSDIDMQDWSDVTFAAEHYLLALALGWMGSALMTEATSIANSITGSVLNNNGAALLSAAGVGTTYAAARFGISKSVSGVAAVSSLAAGGVTAGGAAIATGARALIDRYRNHNGGFKK